MGTSKDLELQWTIWQDRHYWTGELQFRGESFGWDVMIRRDGALVLAQRFPLHAEAARWAEELRGFIERGWKD